MCHTLQQLWSVLSIGLWPCRDSPLQRFARGGWRGSDFGGIFTENSCLAGSSSTFLFWSHPPALRTWREPAFSPSSRSTQFWAAESTEVAIVCGRTWLGSFWAGVHRCLTQRFEVVYNTVSSKQSRTKTSEHCHTRFYVTRCHCMTVRRRAIILLRHLIAFLSFIEYACEFFSWRCERRKFYDFATTYFEYNFQCYLAWFAK